MQNNNAHYIIIKELSSKCFYSESLLGTGTLDTLAWAKTFSSYGEAKKVAQRLNKRITKKHGTASQKYYDVKLISGQRFTNAPRQTNVPCRNAV